MKSHSQQAGRLVTRDIALYGILASMLLAVQLGFAFLPNVELVSLLLIVYTTVLGRRVFYPLYTFVLLEGLLYGFGIWWISYLYVWAVLVIIVLLLREQTHFLLWTVVAGIFGLMFGALTAIPYIFAGGFYHAWAYFLNGIPFDIIHCLGNIVTTLVLYRPLTYLMQRCATLWRNE